MRYTQGQEPLAIGKTSIAIDAGYGNNRKTNFFNVTAFGKTAETMEKFVKKGTKVVLECEAVQNEYNDRNGNKVNTVSFTIKNFEFAEGKATANSNISNDTAEPQSTEGFFPISNSDDDDLPF